MKKLLLAVVGCLLFTSPKLSAQTKQDTIEIKQTCLNYIEGYYTKDVDRMAKALHPELQKRVIFKDENGNCFLQNMGASALVQATRGNRNANLLNPDKPFEAEVIIYNIYENIASVRINNNKYTFMDYAHLGKFNGEWKIINVLWELYPRK